MTSDAIRVGVVGLGYWGPNLARNFDRLPGVELAYCCDLVEANLAKARTQFPRATVTDDLGVLLGDPDLDAVVVATSVPTHYEIGRAALDAGKHALIEKPMALRAADAEDLCAVAAAARQDPHGRPPARVSPRRAQGEGARARAATWGRSSTCTPTGSTWARCGPTRTPSGASARTTSR